MSMSLSATQVRPLSMALPMRKFVSPLVAVILSLSLFLFPLNALAQSNVTPTANFTMSSSSVSSQTFDFIRVEKEGTYTNSGITYNRVSAWKIADSVGTFNVIVQWSGYVKNLVPLQQNAIWFYIGAQLGTRVNTKVVPVISTLDSVIKTASFTLENGTFSSGLLSFNFTPDSDTALLKVQFTFQNVAPTGSTDTRLFFVCLSDVYTDVNIAGDGANWSGDSPTFPDDGSDKILDGVSGGIDSIDNIMSGSNSFISSLSSTFSFISATINRFWTDSDLTPVVILVLTLGLAFYVIGKRVSNS